MADTKKYIKKIKMPLSDGTVKELQIKDAEAISSINGYTVNSEGKLVDDLNNEVYFAEEPISTAKIDEILSK